MKSTALRFPWLWVAAIFALVLAVGFLDFYTGYEISFSIFYLLAISLAFWTLGTPFAVGTAVLSIASWLVGDWVAGVTYPSEFVPAWNASITFGFYVVVIWLLSRLKSSQETLEERIRERTAALAAEMRRRQELEREILIISEREQQRIGHDIHDTLCQHFTATAIAGKILEEKLSADARPEARDATQIVDLVEQGIEIARTLARGLFPVEIEAEGLVSALRELAATYDGRGGISCTFAAQDPPLIGDTFTLAHLYRIAQEAVRNAVQHSGAHEVAITLCREANGARLSIADDGSGMPASPGAGKGMGLHIMRHRAAMIGAAFRIESSPGGGTTVSCITAGLAEGGGLPPQSGSIAAGRK